eukprot:3605502-Pleurochrysis_carterae.AAC.1
MVGIVRAEKWWRASTWDTMVRGSATLPGGIAAWLPALCFMILDAHLEARRVRSGGQLSNEVRRHMPESAPSSSSAASTSAPAQKGKEKARRGPAR